LARRESKSARVARKLKKKRTYEQTWLAPRKALPDTGHEYLVVGVKLAGYDQLGRVLVRYILSHGNFAYVLGRRKGIDSSKDLVVSRRTLATQRMGMSGVIPFWKFEEFIVMHQAKLLRDALWKAQDGELAYDKRLSPETLAAIARDLNVVAPPLDPELARHMEDVSTPEV
jgi:hypothetical protein